MKALKESFFWFAVFIGVLILMSHEQSYREEYVKSLEKVVAKCIDGGAVTIGDEVYLCNTYNTGERI